jgi:hypothetical protein
MRAIVETRRILGVHLAAGVAYLALVDGPDGRFAPDKSVEKIEPSDSLVDGTRLNDFSDRFVQLVRNLSVHVVAVAHPRMYGGWAYTDAFERVSLEATIMLGLKSVGVEYRSVKQSVEVARQAGIAQPDSKAITRGLDAVVARSSVKHWAERSPALLVALAVAKESK